MFQFHKKCSKYLKMEPQRESLEEGRVLVHDEVVPILREFGRVVVDINHDNVEFRAVAVASTLNVSNVYGGAVAEW